jgi:mortality factor 4-like protein 1
VVHTTLSAAFPPNNITRAAPNKTMAVKVGDTVLAYHGVMIYDAKVLKVDNGHGVLEQVGDAGHASASTQFYLHYQGWAKKWDEWVRHDRVLEDSPANRALQKKAKVDVAQAKKDKRLARKTKISSAGVDAPSARKSPFKRLKRSVDNDYEEFPGPDTEGGVSAKQINIQMPFSLKKQLVEDWKNVTHAPHKLVPLPRKPNVSQIIKTYLEFKKSKVHEGEAAEEKEYKNIEGIMEGVQSYFDRALSSILLYRMERRQYQELCQKQTEDVPLSQIYGAEHLIRLFGACSGLQLMDGPTTNARVLAACSEITSAAGELQHPAARAAPDPSASQRLPQVHPEELGRLVRHGVRGRLGEVRRAGHRCVFIKEMLSGAATASKRETCFKFIVLIQHGYISIFRFFFQIPNLNREKYPRCR